MDKKEKTQIVDLLLTTHEFIETENIRAALQSDTELNTAKGVIARLVLMISNTETKEK